MPEPVERVEIARGQLEAARVLVAIEKSWDRAPELPAAKKTSKTDLDSLKPAGFVFAVSSFFFNVILYFFLLFILSFKTFFLSFLLSCSTASFSPLRSLLLSIFFFF